MRGAVMERPYNSDLYRHLSGEARWRSCCTQSTCASRVGGMERGGYCGAVYSRRLGNTQVRLSWVTEARWLKAGAVVWVLLGMEAEVPLGTGFHFGSGIAGALLQGL